MVIPWAIIQYDSLAIVRLRPYSACVSRCLRKRLFELRIWNSNHPRPVQVHYSDRRSCSYEYVSRPPPVLRALTRVDIKVASLKTGQLNVRSLGNKSATLSDIISSNKLDFFSATETWHTGTDCPTLISSTPPGYSYFEQSRNVVSASQKDTAKTARCNHGGVALFYRADIRAAKLDVPIYKTFENISCRLYLSHVNIIVSTIYRPGSKSAGNEFFKDVDSFFTIFDQYNCDLLFMGDINLHLDSVDGLDARKFNDILSDHNLRQHIDWPTHTGGHTLDVVITRSDSAAPGVTAYPPSISDHSLILVALHVATNDALKRRSLRVRKWRNFNADSFNVDLINSELFNTTSSDAVYLADLYKTTLIGLLDKHAPYITRIDRAQDMASWFDDACRTSRIKVRSLERVARRTDLLSDWAVWLQEFRVHRTLLEHKKNSFWKEKILSHQGDTKQLWKTLSAMLEAPGNSNTSELNSDDFAAFFVDKVDQIRQATVNCPVPLFPNPVPVSFQNFSLLDDDGVIKLITNSKSKQCPLDPIPTWLIKKLPETFAVIIGRQINCSISSGFLPPSEKRAIVFPRIKKSGADTSVLANYRPISNLSYTSKLTERAVADQVYTHVELCGRMPALQSAYRPFHSTETALMRIYNDLVLAMDKKMVTGLVLLDLSAAFDTVDHHILIERLCKSFGLGGIVIDWFRSYLSDRTQAICYGSNESNPCVLTCGVPQGSILGPLLFILYAAELSELVISKGICAHFYADDGQLYAIVQAKDIQSAKATLCECIATVHLWCSSNRLKLNPDKTELIWIGSSRILSKCKDDLNITVDGVQIQHKTVVKDLGVMLDENLSMMSHINQLSSTCTYQLRRLRSIRMQLDESSAKTLVNAFVNSKLDYCNGLFCSLPKYMIDKLQRLQNGAARIVTRQRRSDHITPALQSLHWLPIASRVVFKLCVLVYKAQHDMAPKYLQDLCVPVASTERRNLRSSVRGDLCVPATVSKRGERAFSVAGPQAWNDLPVVIRNAHSLESFKSSLKCHLFKIHFNV
jgi:Reverse transcriptase (RNA-dependent DNA polymerase)